MVPQTHFPGFVQCLCLPMCFIIRSTLCCTNGAAPFHCSPKEFGILFKALGTAGRNNFPPVLLCFSQALGLAPRSQSGAGQTGKRWTLKTRLLTSVPSRLRSREGSVDILSIPQV